MTAVDPVAALEAVADKVTREANAVLAHVTPDARSAFSAATATAATMRTIGGSQEQAIAAMTAESVTLSAQGYGEASRIAYGRATELRVAAEAAIVKASADAHSYIGITEATLKASVCPPPAASAATRQLHRQEVDRTIGDGGPAAVSALALLAASQDSELAGEAFSDYSIRQLVRGMGHREATELAGAYRAIALGHRLNQGRYRGVADALTALKTAHGGVDAQRSASLQRISK